MRERQILTQQILSSRFFLMTYRLNLLSLIFARHFLRLLLYNINDLPLV